jgi:hypothetical protein
VALKGENARFCNEKVDLYLDPELENRAQTKFS